MTELPFQTNEFEKIWNEWVQYRKEQKFPAYKPTGLKRTLTELFHDSGGNEETAIKMIINAMKNTWRGIFKLKDLHNGANSKNNAGGVKLGTSAARTEALKNWGIGGEISGGS